MKLHSDPHNAGAVPDLAAGDLWVRSAQTPLVIGGSRLAEPQGMTAFLQTPGMEKAIMPGGHLVGKLKMAVIEPFYALPQYSDGYTLADIKAANPGMKVLAYVNGAIVHDGSTNNGVFETTADKWECQRQGWLVPVPNPDKWTGDHAKKAQDINGNSDSTDQKYVSYGDYSGFFLTRIDSPDYRRFFADYAKRILETPSHSTKGAPDAYFDGVFFDDTNMSPQHGIDMDGPSDKKGATPAANLAPEPYGPWADDTAYGNDMVDFVEEVSRILRYESTQGVPVLSCNIGANPWTPEYRKRALDLASRQVGGGPCVDSMLREFTTSWYIASSDLTTAEVQQVCLFAADLAALGVSMDMADHGKPPTDPAAGPTVTEQAFWERQQRLLNATAILAQPVTPTGFIPMAQPVAIHEGRDNGWSDTGKAQHLWDQVATVDAATHPRIFQDMSVLNQPAGLLRRAGDVLWRVLDRGTVYANYGTTDQTVDGVTVPARDAVIV